MSEVKKYQAAAYLRLSKGDQDVDGLEKAESNSITNQRLIIQRFIDESGDMELVDTYIDDGYTGTNFKRPELKRMMYDIDEGRINCVIVKDLSRFGRERIQTGQYITNIFKQKGVRFVAVNDHYDSLTANGSETHLIMPIKALTNDSYSRDISMKVRSSQAIKRENGQYISAFAPYGYKKDPEDHNHLVVDEEAAIVVKSIFKKKISGMSSNSIADELNAEGVTTPSVYKKAHGDHYVGNAAASKGKWTSKQVIRILQNEVYTGCLVQGKSARISYKVAKVVEKPKDEWVTVKDTHRLMERDHRALLLTRLIRINVSRNHNARILLNNKGEECWNYFTHIYFSGKIKETSGCEFLTKSPQSINSEYKVIVTKEFIATSDVLDILSGVEKKKVWQWKEDRAILDDIFPVDPQFIPETDPTGSKNSEDTLVPIENSLYGSNFAGGYYLCELFSAKNYFSKHLTRADIKNIQKIIDNCKLGFKLERLSDRVGNIVCKVPMDMIKHKALKLSPERGIAGKFKIDADLQKNISCIMQIIIENDNTIIENRTESFVLSEDLPEKEYTIAPNRYKNTIILTDEKTGIIYYSAIRDYSFGSDYYSTIKPPQYIIQQPQKRTIIIEDCEKEIDLINLAGIGEISIEKEIFEMEKRQIEWKKEYEYEHFYFRSFQAGQEKEAIHTVIEICNDKELLWDLKEIWLVDPYLSADDILKTVVHCKKYGINIKCLTRISTINNNTATKIDATECMSQNDVAIAKFRKTLEEALIKQSDMKIEFRTAVGVSFQ